MRRSIFTLAAALLLMAVASGQVTNLGPIKVTSIDTAAPNTWTPNQTGPWIDSGANVIDVRSRGAKCDWNGSSGTDDYTAINNALTDAIAIGGTVKLPDGKTCAYGTTLTITSGNFAIVAGSGAKLRYTGSATDAIVIDGTGLTNGARNVRLENFAIDAPAATNALHTKKMTDSMMSNIDVRGAIGVAFLFDFSVSNTYNHLSCSVNNGAFSTTPTTGILLDNITGNASSNNKFSVPVIEGINGDGIVFTNANANLIDGGTTEGNAGRGLYLSGTAMNNTFQTMDIEANNGNISSSLDIEVASSTARGNKFSNMTVQHVLQIDGAPKETIIDGGQYATITLQAGALNTSLWNVRYATLSDSGTNTTNCGLNSAITCSVANITVSGGGTLNGTFAGAPTWSGIHTFNAAPVFNFGGSFSGGQFGSATQSLYSTYWTSVNANPAASGVLRLAKGDLIRWRNNANSGDVALGINASDQFTVPAIVIGTGTGVVKLAKYTATLTPASVAANTTAAQTFTFTGMAIGDTCVSVSKPTAQAGLGIVGCFNNGTNSIGIVFSNATASPITPTASEVYAATVIQ